LRGLVNGIDLSDAVTLDTPNLIYSPLSFNSIRVRQDLLARDINGIDLARHAILLDRGVYLVPGRVVFDSPVLLVFGLVTPRLGSLDIDFLNHHVLHTSGKQQVTSPVIFISQTSLAGDVKVRYLNGWDPIHVASDVVRVDQECHVVSPKQFMTPELLVRTSLTVNGTLNGVRVPLDIFCRETNQEVTGIKRLIGHQTFDSVAADKLVDGLSLPNGVLSLSRIEEYPSLVFSKGIDVFTDIQETRSVDGVDLRLLDHMGTKGSQGGGRLQNPVFYGPVMVRGNIELQGPVNSVKIGALAADVVLRGTPAEITGKKTFTAGLILPRGLRTMNVMEST